jgi:AraC family transcriptional regulator of adaptative response/methylated-DNA-[protein]-cysteine methyltransferase
LLPTAQDAERHGYSACRRCHPAPGSLAPGEKGVRKALDYIEAHPDQNVTLRILSDISGLSPNHLHHLFARMVGLSPKALCDYRRLIRLKALLRGREPVASASYAAGYGSIRGLYEKAGRMLGMTPAIYQRGGPGVRIRYATSRVSFGRVLVAASRRGVCTVHLAPGDDELVAALHDEFPHAILTREHAPRARWKTVVGDSEPEDPLLSALRLTIRRDVFLARVWTALL